MYDFFIRPSPSHQRATQLVFNGRFVSSSSRQLHAVLALDGLPRQDPPQAARPPACRVRFRRPHPRLLPVAH